MVIDMSNINSELYKRPEETELAYIWRIGKYKDDGVVDMTWDELTDVLNKQLRDPDEEWTSSAYRKKYALIKNAYEQIFSGYQDNEYLSDLTLQKQEIQKERQKLRDERLDLNRRLREEARLETTIECIKDSLNNIADRYFIDRKQDLSPIKSNNHMIVCLSDLHIGSVFDNFNGKYDSDIAKERLNQYLNEIKEIRDTNECSDCYVAILGDCISGTIHRTVSITNKENVVDQVKIASILIADFIFNLSQWFDSVAVYSIGGNHSRIEKKAEDSLVDEKLDDLIPFYVDGILKNISNVTVVLDTFDATLNKFDIGSKTYFVQHGDYTAINESSIGRLIGWSQDAPYCILTGHYHYPSMTELSGVKIVQSGSLCGSGDEFTRSKRLTGKPSQTVIVTKEDGSIYGVYPVELD